MLSQTAVQGFVDVHRSATAPQLNSMPSATGPVPLTPETST